MNVVISGAYVEARVVGQVVCNAAFYSAKTCVHPLFTPLNIFGAGVWKKK